jgi:hypothetical protein
MSNLFSFPPPRFVPRLRSRVLARQRRFWPLREVCARAGVLCRASGPWTERPIGLVAWRSAEIVAEASPRTAVLVRVPRPIWRRGPAARARFALEALAYVLMDLVARESVRGRREFRCTHRPGRPRTGAAISNRDRQRRFRARHRG